MRSLGSHHPKLDFLPALAAAVAAAVALAACGDASSPLENSTDTPTAATTEVVGVAALTTTQRIAWLSYVSGHPELYKMDPQGGSVAPVTALKSFLQAAAWSWDNKRLATVRYRAIDTFHGHNDIWIVNANGTNGHWARLQPSAYNFYDPAWSPDGSRIVVTVDVAGTKALGWLELANGNAGLFWLPGAGAVTGSQPSYNKAGTKIIYVGPAGVTVEQISPDGSGHKIRISSNGAVAFPMFSPDGAKIAYQKDVSGNSDIYVKNFSTGVTTRLTSHAAADAFASWSPDGTRLAFSSNRSGKYQIYTMSATTGGGLARITQTSVEEYRPMWSH
jgi:Tol biopolymer transport system component